MDGNSDLRKDASDKSCVSLGSVKPCCLINFHSPKVACGIWKVEVWSFRCDVDYESTELWKHAWGWVSLDLLGSVSCRTAFLSWHVDGHWGCGWFLCCHMNWLCFHNIRYFCSMDHDLFYKWWSLFRYLGSICMAVWFFDEVTITGLVLKKEPFCSIIPYW